MSLLPREHWFDLDHFYDQFFPTKTKKPDDKFFSPRVDITEKGDNYQILAELPGVKKEDINIHLQDGVLTIEAKNFDETSVEDDKIIRKERRSGYMSRSFTLGPNVNADDIHADFNDGLLKLTAPKIDKTIENKRTISIN